MLLLWNSQGSEVVVFFILGSDVFDVIKILPKSLGLTNICDEALVALDVVGYLA